MHFECGLNCHHPSVLGRGYGELPHPSHAGCSASQMTAKLLSMASMLSACRGEVWTGPKFPVVGDGSAHSGAGLPERGFRNRQRLKHTSTL